MCRRILDVRADREAGGVRLGVDGVAELRGLDERLAALLRGADGGLPPAPVRVFALLEPFQRRLAHALGQRRVDALLVDLREAPDPAEHRPRVAVESDAVHGHASHPPHLLAGK
ncbi:hypothetical protein 2209_scaffold1451_00052 [Bacteriophage sp.]|nr:hypothetical protein 2209_scaffold1451_00052 [Bacteriophage sp.]